MADVKQQQAAVVPEKPSAVAAAAEAMKGAAQMLEVLKGLFEVMPQALTGTASALEEMDRDASEQIQALVAEMETYRTAQEQWEKHSRALTVWGGVNSLPELIESYPVKPLIARALLEEIDAKVRAWTEENPDMACLWPSVRTSMICDMLRAFRAPRVDRISCAQVEAAGKWIESYRIPPPSSRGPLAVELARARAARGISTAEAAKILGVGRTTYRDWEQGRHAPGPGHTAALASYLERSPGEVEALVEAQAAYCSPVYPEERRKEKPQEKPEGAPDYRALRLAAGYSIRQAAKLAGVAKSVVLRADRGGAIKPASAEKLLALYSRAGTREEQARYSAGPEIQAAV